MTACAIRQAVYLFHQFAENGAGINRFGSSYFLKVPFLGDLQPNRLRLSLKRIPVNAKQFLFGDVLIEMPRFPGVYCHPGRVVHSAPRTLSESFPPVDGMLIAVHP